MTEQEFLDTLACDTDFIVTSCRKCDEKECPHVGEGYEVVNRRFQTKTHIGLEAIRNHSLPKILASFIQGKDVDHITRITGYWGKVKGWNKGKLGELKDRYHHEAGI